MRQLFGVVCALLLGCSAATADPIVVTGGLLSVASPGGSEPFLLLGDGLSLSGVGTENFLGPASCNPCITEPITFNGTLDSWVPTPVTETVGGTVFPNVFLAGTMSFSGPTFPASLAASTGSLTAPFTFFATLRGFADSSLTGPPLFDNTFTGSGTASATFAITPGPGATLIFSRDVVYRFGEETASPAPEPASMALMLTGLAAVALRWRGRNR